MRRFFVGLGVGIVLALGCVQQKIALIRIGYAVEELSGLRDELLDQRQVLQYNVLTLRSPVILRERLAQRNIQLIPPRTVEVLYSPLRGNPSAPSLEAATRPALFLLQRALRLAMDWLGAARQAVAQPFRGLS
jgi:hypothetical protein